MVDEAVGTLIIRYTDGTEYIDASLRKNICIFGRYAESNIQYGRS